MVMATGAMVATRQPMATATALQILRSGGNAMDAAVAASATLCVIEPLSTGIGGDCFLLYHEAATGELHALNGSGRATGYATPDEVCAYGMTTVPERGILSVTVPGVVDAWQTVVERFGSYDFGTLLKPAIDYAENGFAALSHRSLPAPGKNMRSCFGSMLTVHEHSCRMARHLWRVHGITFRILRVLCD